MNSKKKKNGNISHPQLIENGFATVKKRQNLGTSTIQNAHTQKKASISISQNKDSAYISIQHAARLHLEADEAVHWLSSAVLPRIEALSNSRRGEVKEARATRQQKSTFLLVIFPPHTSVLQLPTHHRSVHGNAASQPSSAAERQSPGSAGAASAQSSSQLGPCSP